MIEQHDGCIIQCCKTFGSVGLRNVYPSGYVFVICAYQSSTICVVFVQGILVLVMAVK